MRQGTRPMLRVAAILLVAQGCATAGPPPLAPEHLAELASGSDVTVVHYFTPPFRRVHPQAGVGWSAVPVLGLLVGPVAAAATAQQDLEEGERIRMQLGLDDPVTRVHGRLVASLADTAGPGHLQTVAPRVLSNDDPRELRAMLGAGLVLDFRTIGWGVVATTKFLPGTTHRYQVFYHARGRVVRLADSGIVWQATCASVGRDTDGKWTLDELRAADGTLLKTRLEDAADLCAEQLATQLVGRPARR